MAVAANRISLTALRCICRWKSDAEYSD